LLALYEGGLPYLVEEGTLIDKGFSNLDFIKKGFSEHPKVDPVNGDIFNIGFRNNKLDLYRITKDLKLITSNTVDLR
jgi:carotenoid cleavage dioxygenase-like enzyme